MSLFDSDINIFYGGASGGFLLLHLLLLEDKHRTAFPISIENKQKFFEKYPHRLNNIRISKEKYQELAGADYPEYDVYFSEFEALEDSLKQELLPFHKTDAANLYDLPEWFNFFVDELVAKQWNIQRVSDWKNTETWPVNHETAMLSVNEAQHKLYYVCDRVDSWLDNPGKKIVLYTDVRTQLRLALSKNAHWFWKGLGDLGQDKSFTRIKGILRDCDRLNGHQVPTVTRQVADMADECIFLQDMLADPKNILGISVNEKQRKLIDTWVELHKKFKLYDKNFTKEIK